MGRFISRGFISRSFVFRGMALAASAVLAAMAAAGQAKAENFTLISPGLADNGMLALKNAGKNPANPNCLGDNVSPPLAWSNAPGATKSFALLAYDPEGAGGLGVTHWVAYGVAANVVSLAEGEAGAPSAKFTGGKNTPGTAVYYGPCPPAGNPHHYNFTIIATDLEPAALAPGLTRDELFGALKGHALGATGFVGRFAHP